MNDEFTIQDLYKTWEDLKVGAPDPIRIQTAANCDWKCIPGLTRIAGSSAVGSFMGMPVQINPNLPKNIALMISNSSGQITVLNTDEGTVFEIPKGEPWIFGKR